MEGRIINNNDIYIKLFDVSIDNSINFSTHISDVSKKASRKVAVLSDASSYAT